MESVSQKQCLVCERPITGWSESRRETVYCDVCKNRTRRRGVTSYQGAVELKREFVKNAKNKPCVDCGKSYPPYIMDFDHVKGKKSFSISDSIYKKGIRVIQKEIEKCDVVCSNCHRARTYLRGERFGEMPIR